MQQILALAPPNPRHPLRFSSGGQCHELLGLVRKGNDVFLFKNLTFFGVAV